MHAVNDRGTLHNAHNLKFENGFSFLFLFKIVIAHRNSSRNWRKCSTWILDHLLLPLQRPIIYIFIFSNTKEAQINDNILYDECCSLRFYTFFLILATLQQNMKMQRVEDSSKVISQICHKFICHNLAFQ